MEGGPDRVELIIESWRTERPDIDLSAKEVTGRILRASGLILARCDEAFAPLGLKRGEYGALVTLRRSGPPYELRSSELGRNLMLSSAGMSLQIDRLQRRGLVDRRANPADRRGVLVGLTPAGFELTEAAMGVHADVEHRAVAGLTARQAETLSRHLRRLLTAMHAH